MGEVYKMTIAGCERELPICPISDTLDIAGFVMFGDVEITEKAAKALMEKCPEHDIIITAESKGIPLAYEMARIGCRQYVVARKGIKAYMTNPIKYVDWEGGENAKGYYISEGKMLPITWSKAGMYDPLKFFDANGNELQLNRGKSYIAFTYAGNCKVEG